MRIDPTSEAGRLLLEMGVPEEDLEAARFVRFNWQAGGAITLPIPFGGAVVLAKNRYVVTGDDGAIAVGRHLALLRHELVHVRQRKDWGILRYWMKHLWARVTTGSLLARESDAERPGYEAQHAAYQFLDERGIN